MDQNPWIWFLPVHDKKFSFSWGFMDVSFSEGVNYRIATIVVRRAWKKISFWCMSNSND